MICGFEVDFDLWGCFWDYFEVDFGSFWELLEVIFASLRPPGTPLVSWFTPGGPQDPPRSVWERLLGPSGADFGPTWRELDFSSLKNAFFRRAFWAKIDTS